MDKVWVGGSSAHQSGFMGLPCPSTSAEMVHPTRNLYPELHFLTSSSPGCPIELSATMETFYPRAVQCSSQLATGGCWALDTWQVQLIDFQVLIFNWFLSKFSHLWPVATLLDSEALVHSDLHSPPRRVQLQPRKGRPPPKLAKIFMSPTYLVARMGQPSQGGWELFFIGGRTENYFIEICWVFATCLGALPMWSHEIFAPPLCGEGDCSHFADGKTEASRGEITCLMSQNW